MNYTVRNIIDFCEELFPGLSPYTADAARKALDQFDNNNIKISLLNTQSLSYFSQGDIFTNIPLIYIDDNGDQYQYLGNAMLLTNTCDSCRNDNLQFAAIHRVEELGDITDFQNSVRHNKTYQFLYLPDSQMCDSAIDFGLITSVSRTLIEELWERGNIGKIASLSQIGYYMLLAKLTVFFMRPEDTETNEQRLD